MLKHPTSLRFESVLDKYISYRIAGQTRKGDQALQMGHQIYEVVRGLLCNYTHQDQLEDVLLLGRVSLLSFDDTEVPFIGRDIVLTHPIFSFLNFMIYPASVSDLNSMS